MSFREVRCLCERIRALGCKQVVSMENFRSPNFELVAELLYWLLRRYDPDTGIADDIDTPAERVKFLQEIAQTMFVKARIKLNIKRLYAADGKAVRELLKVADLLYRASREANADPEDLARQTDAAMVELSALDSEAKNARQIIADITKAGAEIYDGLGREAQLKEARQTAVAQQLDKNDVEGAVQEAIEQLLDEEERLRANLEELQIQKHENTEKLKRKRAEFERMEQRLLQLKSVRAPYQDDLDKLEGELQGYYAEYLTKFRTLEYLEAELARIRREEEKRMKAEEAKLEKLRRKIADHDWKMIRGQLSVHERDLNHEFQDLDEDSDEDDVDSNTASGMGGGVTMVMPERPHAPGRAQAQGSLMADMDDRAGSEQFDATDHDLNDSDEELEQFGASRAAKPAAAVGMRAVPDMGAIDALDDDFGGAADIDEDDEDLDDNF